MRKKRGSGYRFLKIFIYAAIAVAAGVVISYIAGVRYMRTPAGALFFGITEGNGVIRSGRVWQSGGYYNISRQTYLIYAAAALHPDDTIHGILTISDSALEAFNMPDADGGFVFIREGGLAFYPFGAQYLFRNNPIIRSISIETYSPQLSFTAENRSDEPSSHRNFSIESIADGTASPFRGGLINLIRTEDYKRISVIFECGNEAVFFRAPPNTFRLEYNIHSSFRNIYIGEINSNAQRHGFGIYFSDINRSYYAGRYLNDIKNGHGAIFSADGFGFFGYMRDGMKNGFGEYIKADGTSYRGYFRNNKKHGLGVFISACGKLYEGSFEYGFRHGFGVMSWPSGELYKGDWHLDSRTGAGSFFWPCGEWYEGEFKNDTIEGTGIYHWSSGRSHTGEFRNGRLVIGGN